MKVRWTRESVRFRITPTELEALLRGEPVREAMPLPGGGAWAATVAPGTGGPTRLDSDRAEIVLRLAAADRERLAAPDSEGVYFPAEGGGLRFFVEKDFPCLHPRALEAIEPQTEAFAPPEGFAERKGVAT